MTGGSDTCNCHLQTPCSVSDCGSSSGRQMASGAASGQDGGPFSPLFQGFWCWDIHTHLYKHSKVQIILIIVKTTDMAPKLQKKTLGTSSTSGSSI